jgi:hypothetical protein
MTYLYILSNLPLFTVAFITPTAKKRQDTKQKGVNLRKGTMKGTNKEDWEDRT